MCHAGWFGQAIFGCACKGDGDRIVEGALIADGDEKRFYVGACSQYCADDLLFVFKGGATAFFEWWFVEGSDQSAFCTAYGWFVEEQPEMCSQSESSRVGDTLAVD